MTDENIRKRINKGVVWVANAVFGMAESEKVKYAKAYDKLNSRFYLENGYSISDRLKSPEMKDKTIFDTLLEGELEMLLDSQIKLENMYKEVLVKKAV